MNEYLRLRTERVTKPLSNESAFTKSAIALYNTSVYNEIRHDSVADLGG